MAGVAPGSARCRQHAPAHGTAQAVPPIAPHSATSSARASHARQNDGGAATGVMWSDQKDVYKTYRPIKVYRPEG